MKWLRSTLILLILLSAVFSSATFGPGTSGGGGDAHPDSKPHPEDIPELVNQAKGLLPFVLYSLENDYQPGRNGWYYPVLKALFDNQEVSVYEKLEKLSFSTRPLGPCFDRNGIEKAASAYPFESLEVCFSAERISEATVVATVERRVLALALHELIHKMGFHDEELIVALEKHVSENLPLSPWIALDSGFRDLWEKFETGPRSSLPYAIDQALSGIESGDSWGSICFDVARVTLRAEGTSELSDFLTDPLSLLRPRDRFELESIERRASYLALYCQRDRHLEDLIDGDFQGNEELSVDWVDPVKGSKVTYKIARPVFEDQRILLKELNALKKSVSRISVSSLENGAQFYDSVPEDEL